ncbi:MAG: hypothetical protein HZB41_07420 [Ignavibacteriae bacterium]|nr:hypothetical protein [Ignavibacteriota bacterium]
MTITTSKKNNRNLHETNYEEYRNKEQENTEFREKYLFAKEKLHLELMVETVKESILKKKDEKIIMRNLNKLSRYIGRIAL